LCSELDHFGHDEGAFLGHLKEGHQGPQGMMHRAEGKQRKPKTAVYAPKKENGPGARDQK
jgi:hypothetical protein